MLRAHVTNHVVVIVIGVAGAATAAAAQWRRLQRRAVQEAPNVLPSHVPGLHTHGLCVCVSVSVSVDLCLWI